MTARAAVSLAIALMVAAGAGLGSATAQQMYKWTDDKGVVHYSDTPPPAKEKRVEVKDFSAASMPMAPPVQLPFALAQAVKNNPVTLFTGSDCVPCDQARNALRERGVPYTEKTVATNADRAKLIEAGGSDTLPFIAVGRKTLAGYAPADLQDALTAASYPATRRLPPGYRNPPVQTAAPAAVALPTAPAPADDQPVLPDAPPPSPTGIRF
jgi:glutaredoxin